MGSFTIKNLAEVENVAPKFGMPDGMEAHFAREDLGAEKSGLSYQRLGPEMRMPFGHRHADEEETYVILAGSGRMKLDDEVVNVGPRDAIRVASDVTRALEAGPGGLEWVVFGAPGLGNDDVEMTPDWWSA